MRGFPVLRFPLLLPQALSPGEPMLGKGFWAEAIGRKGKSWSELIKHSLSFYCLLYARR